MAERDNDHGIEGEPHFKGERKRSSRRDRYEQDHSIFNEPALAADPQSAARIVDHDLFCAKCGYNRRGLPMIQPCPECGHVPVYAAGQPNRRRADAVKDEPRPAGTPAYAAPIDQDQAKHSVFNELPIFPHTEPDGREHFIDRDWHCTRCGYNLRGRYAGQPCPECGHVQQDRPPPPHQVSYANWLRQKIAATSEDKAMWITFLAMLAGGPWAVIWAMFNNSTFFASIPLLVVAVAPVVEETMKIALAAYIVEVKPYLFKSATQVRLAVIASGFMFGVLENVYYCNLILPAMGAPQSMYLFRWVVCTALHVSTTVVSSFGLVKVWTNATRNFRQPRLDEALPWIVGAMVLHGLYNGGALLFELATQQF